MAVQLDLSMTQPPLRHLIGCDAGHVVAYGQSYTVWRHSPERHVKKLSGHVKAESCNA